MALAATAGSAAVRGRATSDTSIVTTRGWWGLAVGECATAVGGRTVVVAGRSGPLASLHGSCSLAKGVGCVRACSISVILLCHRA